MAADVPAKKATAKKSAAKKAPAKKAPVKKAPVKKAPVKKAPVKKAPARRVPAKDVTKQSPDMPAIEAVPAIPPAPMEAPELLPTTDVVTSRAAAQTTGQTFVETVLRLDWRSTAQVAGPSFLVLFAVGCFLALPLLFLPQSSDQSTTGFGGAGGFFHAVALLAAMTFGSSANGSGSSSGDGSTFSLGGGVMVMPLTMTILVLLVFAGLCRRYVPTEPSVKAAGAVFRASGVFALLAMALSFFAHTSVGGSDSSDGRVTVGASPAAVFGWALILTALVGLVATLGPAWLARLRADDVRTARWAPWRLPVEGGVAALVTSVLLGGVVLVIALFADRTPGHPAAADVARALPLILGLFVNIGLAVTAIALGANVGIMATGVGSDASVGYAHLHTLSPGYFLLLLLPVFSVAAGIWWMLHRRREEDDRAVWRACYRMAASYAVSWVILAMIGRVSIGAGLFGGAHAGPQLLLGFGLALGWALILGLAYGRLLLARGMPNVRPFVLRFPGLRWRPVTTAATVVIVAIAVADIATGGAPASASSRHASARSAIPQPPPPPLSPRPLPTFSRDFEAESALTFTSSLEEAYRSRHGRYTVDRNALNAPPLPGDVNLAIVRADRSSYCIVARVGRGGTIYSYSSATRRTVPGDIC
ncbi:MAG: hypothetical protein ACJ735_00065 [Actinomycetes bacterium]